MPLIVETGQGLPNADSYVSLEDGRATAAKYGLELPEDDTKAEAALRNGAVYVGLFESQMCGRRVSANQALAFPRTGITLHGFPQPSNAIPSLVIQAQVIAAVEYGTGTDVRGSTDGREVQTERVEGAVTVSYFKNGYSGCTVSITAADDALRPLLCGSNNAYSFNVFRG
ncbi:DnaT-like ssDNA-binding protein [Salmonella enterica]|uniref:DnaT-like ssDNA-binding protein n=1 Tax=Salmonella enterica TaxID=28901 RepID=UPI002B2248DD|nr:DnaT-like ssDNA-binding protein [Salmonella enterica]MEA9005141.1 hypothetical protein [Salmonella enterica subsp. enterica]MEA9061183.1 hypothetical protein [Salmonella enterica subsp. enterica]